MIGTWSEFCKILDDNLKDVLDKNIIIYGCNSRGGDFVRWYLKTYYNKEIKAFVDRWELSTIKTIPHLWAFYYIYDKEDIIVNTTPLDIIEEFNDTGEEWDRLSYKKNQIINLWEKIYIGGGNESVKSFEITYFDWLEYKCQIDLMITVKRSFTTGEHSHGYFPTDFRIFLEGVSYYDIDSEKDAILDIGCGKGSGIISFLATGFKRIGAIEYTKDIYDRMKDNLNKLDIKYSEYAVETSNEFITNNVKCYYGDATKLKEQLDEYNWFFLFNPFSWDIMKVVLGNICDSLRKRPRQIHIFYAEPIGHKLIMETELFELKHRITTDMSGVSYYSYIYDSVI